MKLVRLTTPEDEPEWENFSTHATDFRPHWDGDLVNVFTTLRPQSSIPETQAYAMDCARRLAAWILKKRNHFGAGDHFQIILAWTSDVRATGRQIVRTGGSFAQLEGIASGVTDVPMHGNWTANVFKDQPYEHNPDSTDHGREIGRSQR